MMANLTKDRGASIILVTASLLVLMGIAAVVVDGGLGFSERRQAQSGVDFGSLAALTYATGADPAVAGANEAIAVVEENLPGRSLEWDTCTDPSRPAEYSVVPTSVTECVSFTNNFDQARVMLPDDDVATTFGRVLGFAKLTVVAAAEAEQNLRITSSVIPFTIAGDGCLYSNQAPQSVPPCDGPDSGNFGYLDIALYGNDDDEYGTPSTCDQGTTNARIAINLAKGSDHNIVEYDGGTPVNDHATCPNRSENIDELAVRTGSPTGGITDGLINGSPSSINSQPVTPSPGLLKPNPYSASTTTVRGDVLDDTPLWHFLNGNGPSECNSPEPDTQSAMKACLTAWNSGHGPIFDRDLEFHNRFAAVPMFNFLDPDDPYSGGSGAHTINRFVPLYLQTLYQGCNSNRCKTIFSPGESGKTDTCPDPLNSEPNTINCGHDESGGNSVEGLTSLVLELGMLHPDTQEYFPGRLEGRELLLLK